MNGHKKSEGWHPLTNNPAWPDVESKIVNQAQDLRYLERRIDKLEQRIAAMEKELEIKPSRKGD